MPAPADEPLTRCNLNLFTADKEWLEKRFGRGWTEAVRNLVRKHIRDLDQVQEVDMKIIGGFIRE